jgi:hypothetical protein
MDAQKKVPTGGCMAAINAPLGAFFLVGFIEELSEALLIRGDHCALFAP